MNFFAMSANESKKCTCCEVKHSMNFIIVYETSGKKKFKTVLGQKKKNNPIIKLLHNVSQDSIWQANKAKKKIWKPKPVVSNHILKCYR